MWPDERDEDAAASSQLSRSPMGTRDPAERESVLLQGPPSLRLNGFPLMGNRTGQGAGCKR